MHIYSFTIITINTIMYYKNKILNNDGIYTLIMLVYTSFHIKTSYFFFVNLVLDNFRFFFKLLIFN